MNVIGIWQGRRRTVGAAACPQPTEESSNALCFLSLLLAALFPLAASADTAGVTLTLSERRLHDCQVTRAEGGVLEVRTTGRDPYFFAELANADIDRQSQFILQVEYLSLTGAAPLEVFLDPMTASPASVQSDGLALAEGWTTHSVDLRPLMRQGRKPMRGLRIDPGRKAGNVLRIRSMTLRGQTPKEQQLEAVAVERRKATDDHEQRLTSYLARTFDASVTAITVDEKSLCVEGRVVVGTVDGFLAEVPIWSDATRLTSSPLLVPLTPGSQGQFTVTVDRFALDGGRQRDRLLSRWAVVRQDPAGLSLQSAARWADAVKPAADAPPMMKPSSKKGIGGFVAGRLTSDLDDLGIDAVTVNLPLSAFMRTDPGPGRTSFDYAGRTWWAEDRALAGFDLTLREAAKRKIVVSAIVLIPYPKSGTKDSFLSLAAHPDADPAGIFTMPNFTSREGSEAYAAAMDFIARRYSRSDGRFGRVHHYILHNEVDAGWQWTNAGEKPIRVYLDLYHRSMRVAHLIARQYDPNAKAFISLTHHWAKAGGPPRKFYASRDLLDLLVEFSRVEGDFDWAIAHHPYPQSLLNPRTWEDTQATFSLDTPKITFRNIEVLDAWVSQPRTLFAGKSRRTVHLTEQGLNSPDYSETSLLDQAAGMAYAWAKVRNLDSIEAFQYHNWIDNRHEGGLRIGLRRFPDDEVEPLGKKPIWHLYKALGTPEEAAAMGSYLQRVALEGWEAAIHRGPVR